MTKTQKIAAAKTPSAYAEYCWKVQQHNAREASQAFIKKALSKMQEAK